MTHQFVQYSYLQTLDFLTTLVFLLYGIQEGNPMVRLALDLAPSPVWGLLWVKTLAIALGIYCWKMGKLRLLSRINLFFALIVAWNLVALLAGALARS